MTPDQAEVLLQFVEHSRTSCDDDSPDNWYTTAGRGGYPRCTRCALIRASKNRQFAELLEIYAISVRMPEVT